MKTFIFTVLYTVFSYVPQEQFSINYNHVKTSGVFIKPQKPQKVSTSKLSHNYTV